MFEEIKGNTITQRESWTLNLILFQFRERIKIVPVCCTVPSKLHYYSTKNSFYRLFALFWQGLMGGAWDSETALGGRIMVCWGSTPSANAVGRSCVRLRRLISAITAQLDWPDILARFVSGILRSMKASYRQLLLQQSFSIFGARGSVWRAVWDQGSGRTDAAFYENSSSFVEQLEKYLDQLRVNRRSFAEKMCISLFCESERWVSLVCPFMCLSDYCGRSLNCPISCVNHENAAHDSDITAEFSLSFPTEPLGGEHFPQRSNFLPDLWPSNHPYINSFFCLPSFSPFCLTSPSSSDLFLSFLVFSPSPSLRTHLSSLISPLKPARRSSAGPPNPRWPCRRASCCGSSWCGSSSRSRSGGSGWGSRPCSTRRPARPRRPPSASASRPACPLSLRCRWRCWRWAGEAGLVRGCSRSADTKQRTDESKFFLSVCQFSASGIRRGVCHCCGLNGRGGSVFIEFMYLCVCVGVCDTEAITVLLWPCVKKHRSEWSVLKCVYGDYLSRENSSWMHAVLPAIWI